MENCNFVIVCVYIVLCKYLFQQIQLLYPYVLYKLLSFVRDASCINTTNNGNKTRRIVDWQRGNCTQTCMERNGKHCCPVGQNAEQI